MVRYTVDFHYEGVDHSIPGESQILLSELIDILNITDESGAKIDVADVVDVSFSDAHLVKVEQVSGMITYNDNENVDVGEKDFLLTSLEPFTSDEVLTITLDGGEVITVGVTDEQTNDLKDLLDSVTITGAEMENGKYKVKTDVEYKINMHFTEKTNGIQFNENSLTYSFADIGFNPGNASGRRSIKSSSGKDLYFDYTIQGGVMTITWDKNSEGYADFLNAENTVLDVEIIGIFNKSKVSFSDTVIEEVSLDPNTFGNKISKSTFSKEPGEVTDGANGKKLVTWTITLNQNANISMGGNVVRDQIDSGSTDVMRYAGDGITVQKFNKDGSSAGGYSVPWGTSNDSSKGTLTNSKGGSEWSWTIPTDNGNYKYVITYQTEVDADEFLTKTTVKNHAGDNYGHSDSSKDVEPSGDAVTASKRVVSNAIDTKNRTAETTWEITFDVPARGLNSAVVTDVYPNQSNTYFDTLKPDSISVNAADLVDGEHAEIDTSDPKKATITFYKSAGTSQPGLNSTSAARQIHITLTTVADPNWLNYADTNTWARTHTNTGDVTVNGQKIPVTASDEYDMTPKDLEKFFKGTYSSNGNPSLPIYEYRIILTCVNNSAFDENGDLYVYDNYDANYLAYSQAYSVDNGNVNGNNGIVYGNGQYNKNDLVAKGPYVVDSSSTDGQLVFKLNKDDLPMDGQNYYAYYAICYFLQVKDATTLQTLKDLALTKEGVKVPLMNSASAQNFGDATVTNNYEVEVIKKTKTAAGMNNQTNTYDVSFKVEVNKDALKIGDGDTITVTDTLTNLSMDYASIVVSPQLEGDIVNRDGFKVIFTLRNQTHYTITYTTRLDGFGTVNWRNNAELKADGFPPVYFNLYKRTGSNSEHDTLVYSNIELKSTPDNPETDYRWECPDVLDEDGEYYAIETNKTGQVDNLTWELYGYSSYDGKEDPGQDHWRLGVTQADNDARMAYVDGNEGTITIRNKLNDYLEFDIKKKWVELRPNSEGPNASWYTTTTEDYMLRDLVFGFKVIRRTRRKIGDSYCGSVWPDGHPAPSKRELIGRISSPKASFPEGGGPQSGSEGV